MTHKDKGSYQSSPPCTICFYDMFLRHVFNPWILVLRKISLQSTLPHGRVEGVLVTQIKGVSEGVLYTQIKGVSEGALMTQIKGVLEGALMIQIKGVLECVLETQIKGVLEGVLKTQIKGVLEGVFLCNLLSLILPCPSWCIDKRADPTCTRDMTHSHVSHT